MANVGDRIAAFQAQQPALSDELQRFLDIVWTHRVAHANKDHAASVSADNADVYGLYARAASHRSGLHMVRPFLQGLLVLPQLPEIQSVPTHDPHRDPLGNLLCELYGAVPAPSGFSQLSHEQFTDLVEDAQRDDALATALGDTFYHFRRALTGSTDRIYLRVQAPYMMTVIRHVVTTMLRDPVAYPGLSNAKVAVPGGFERADSIVIYLDSPAAMNRALDGIAAYQHQPEHRACFEPGHTRGTRGIDRHNGIELVGVAIGAEPPVDLMPLDQHRLVLVPGASSFGSFRAALIRQALVNTMAVGQDKAHFIQRTLAYFRDAGIDPRLQHQHGMAPQLVARARATLRSLRHGQEPRFTIG